MTINKFGLLICSLFLLASCGEKGGSKQSNQPKDLNFAAITDVAEYCDKIKYAITSRRSGILKGQLANDQNIDARAFKQTVNSYAEAISRKDWVIDDLDLEQDGNKFTKSYRWLDKRHRMAMTIKVDLTKQGSNINLQTVTFDTNIEVLEKITY